MIAILFVFYFLVVFLAGALATDLPADLAAVFAVLFAGALAALAGALAAGLAAFLEGLSIFTIQRRYFVIEEFIFDATKILVGRLEVVVFGFVVTDTLVAVKLVGLLVVGEGFLEPFLVDTEGGLLFLVVGEHVLEVAMPEVFLAVGDDALLFLAGLGKGVKLALFSGFIAVIVKQRLVEIFAKGVYLDVELDHIGGVLRLERNDKNSLTVRLHKLCYIVAVAVGIGFFE